jgi:hypothetical protein
MALLGSKMHNLGPTFVSFNTGGTVLAGLFGLQHSLQTVPERVIFNYRSVNAFNSAVGNTRLFMVTADQTFATLGFAVGSVPSFPPIMFDAFLEVIYNPNK